MKDLQQLINANADAFVEELKRLIAIPSVKEAPLPNAPFGKGPRAALDMALELAKEMGFEIRDFDGYAGDATIGGDTATSGEVMGVLCHLDVVPAGEDWTVCPPFSPIVKNGNMYGRGASDNKGPTIAALFALKAVKEAGYTFKKRVRLIFGCDEESGWGCMNHYFAHAESPDFGFAPDSGFPVCYAEKGILHARLDFPLNAPEVISIAAGQRANVVPDRAEARVSCLSAAVASCNSLPRDTAVAAEADANGVTLRATGISAHGSTPGKGANAGAALLLALGRTLGGQLAELCRFLGIAASSGDGAGFGISCADEPSGSLTCNLGVLKGDQNGISATLDIRYPVTADRAALKQKLTAAIAPFGGSVTEVGGHEALYMPKDDPILLTFLNAYREVTGDDSPPYHMGGGTYARSMKRCVAFGASFPGGLDVAHKPDEFASVNDLLRATLIYARTFVKLCC